MRQSVTIVLGALSGAFVMTATPPLGPPAVHAQTNWREVRSLKMGRFRVRVDVSPARTVRLYSQLDTSRLTSPELPADTVKAWQQMVFSELDKPTRREYMLGNAILVQPFAADSTSVGYVLTVADTSVPSETVPLTRVRTPCTMSVASRTAATARSDGSQRITRAMEYQRGRLDGG